MDAIIHSTDMSLSRLLEIVSEGRVVWKGTQVGKSHVMQFFKVHGEEFGFFFLVEQENTAVI